MNLNTIFCQHPLGIYLNNLEDVEKAEEQARAFARHSALSNVRQDNGKKENKTFWLTIRQARSISGWYAPLFLIFAALLGGPAYSMSLARSYTPLA
jgi:hypothetical protein